MSRRPLLMVSVRSAAEAEEAIAGGADWIDLKEPTRGPLGPVDAAVAREIVACVGTRTPISAAAGEFRDWADGPGRQLLDVPGLTQLKLGLASCRDAAWRDRWLAAHDEIRGCGKSLVAAIYADAAMARAPNPLEVIALAAEARASWVLWDTFDKTGPSLVDQISSHEMAAQLNTAHATGLRAVVAGRLTLETIAALPLDDVDMIAVRGAACVDDRTSAVRRSRVAALGDVLRRHRSCVATR